MKNTDFLLLVCYWISFFGDSISGTGSTTSRARYETIQIWRRKVVIHSQISYRFHSFHRLWELESTECHYPQGQDST